MRVRSLPHQTPAGLVPPLIQTAKSEPRRRVLIVDDYPEAARTLAMLLKLRGFETRTATDGLEAVETAGGFRPDVVILDLGLPGVDGYEACRRIRASAWGKAMRLLALTGWARDEDRERSAAAGFNGHVLKPIDLEVLEPLLT